VTGLGKESGIKRKIMIRINIKSTIKIQIATIKATGRIEACSLSRSCSSTSSHLTVHPIDRAGLADWLVLPVFSCAGGTNGTRSRR
jgi:hypothetical protein